jgi:hypothetical protein
VVLSKYVTLKIYFAYPSLVIHLLATPPIKLKLGQQNRWVTTNSKPHGPIIMIDQSESINSSQSDHIYYTIFSKCTALLGLLPATPNCGIRLSQNHFPEPNSHILSFLHPILLCRSHAEHRWRCSHQRSPGFIRPC